MTNQEALELGLALAELESKLKARETPASPEEAGEMLREIMARKAAEKQPETPQPASVNARKPYFSKETMAAVMKEQDEEREYQASLNPKGVPIIFPGY